MGERTSKETNPIGNTGSTNKCSDVLVNTHTYATLLSLVFYEPFGINFHSQLDSPCEHQMTKFHQKWQDTNSSL